MNNTKDKIEISKNLLRHGLSYFIALATLAAGPAVVSGTFCIAVISGDAAFAGLGLLSGALLAAVGAVMTVWCLGRARPTA